MSKALAVVEPQTSVAVTQKDLDDYLFGTGTKLTEAQKKLFFGIALAQNLNPLKREIYAVAYGSNFNVITGYEVYLARAERTGLLDGWEATVKGMGSDMVATCTIWRKDRSKPTVIEAWFSEYNTGQSLWKSKPRTMLRKVAIAQAFRMTFPTELGGIPYTSDEIAAGDVQEAEYTPLDKLAEKVAGDDLQERVTKAMVFLAKKGVQLSTAENFVGYPADEWTDEHLDAIKKWAKAGFPIFPASPEAVSQQIDPEEGGYNSTNGTTQPEVVTASQDTEAPDLGECLTKLRDNGWPLEKLEVKFGMKAKDWGESQLSQVADLANSI